MINDKQFIIGKTKHDLPGWKHIRLGNGLVFSFQEKLKVWTNDKANVLLLGHAWQVDPDRKEPVLELEKLLSKETITHSDVFEMEKTWCGRYLLIINDWIYLDTIGALGVFYSAQHVCSSLNVLCKAEGRDVVYPDITLGIDPDFIPGMRTCYDGVRRLLPSQIYNLVTHEVKARPLLPDGTIAANSYEERMDLLEKFFVHSLQNMGTYFKGQRLWLGLTGGRDSRVALAMMEKTGLDYSTYTCLYKWINEADEDIPYQISRKVKREHVYLKMSESQFSQKRHDDYRTHTAGMSIDLDWQYYAFDYYRPLHAYSEDLVLLRNSIWEIPNDYYSGFCEGGRLDFEKVYPAIMNNALLRDSLSEWYEYVSSSSVNKEISIWNMMLWELRAGCWISSIEQSYDMMEHITSIQPCNCRLFLSILMGFSQSDRFAKRHMEMIVQRVCPAIRKIPYEFQYNRRVKLKTRIHRILRKMYRKTKK